MKTTICLTCETNEIPIARWNLPCAECRKKRKAAIEKRIAIGRRMAAAIVEPPFMPGVKVYVDKFGHEVQNPGYDLEHDKFGWGFTGKKAKPVTVIK